MDIVLTRGGERVASGLPNITTSRGNNMVEKTVFVQRSKNAYLVCFRCGNRFGRLGQEVEPEGKKGGKCDVCGRNKFVFDFKKFGFSKFSR